MPTTRATPTTCPHCGRTPTFEELLLLRPACADFGHPEQLELHRGMGWPLHPCVICGETPADRVVEGRVLGVDG